MPIYGSLATQASTRLHNPKFPSRASPQPHLTQGRPSRTPIRTTIPQSPFTMAKKRTFPPSSPFELSQCAPIHLSLLHLHTQGTHRNERERRKQSMASNRRMEQWLTREARIAKSRTVAVRLISMALTGYYKTLIRPRTHRPLSMLKYDPVGTSPALCSQA
jgi:hypothetical protein